MTMNSSLTGKDYLDGFSNALTTLLGGWMKQLFGPVTQPIRLDDVVIVEGEWGRVCNRPRTGRAGVAGAWLATAACRCSAVQRLTRAGLYSPMVNKRIFFQSERRDSLDFICEYRLRNFFAKFS